MKRGFSILAIVTALLLSFALYEALVGAPTERTMGDVQRIFYYHVPSAWTALSAVPHQLRGIGRLSDSRNAPRRTSWLW